MYFYLYDSFVLDKKYESLLTKIEHRLIELGINGQIGKLSVLKNMDQMLEEAVKRGADNVVIVGNDKTFARAIKTLAKEKASIGYIPIGENSDYARILGIPNALEAANILSRRTMERIDVGKINNSVYFLTSVDFDNEEIILECDKKFKIFPETSIKKISVCNSVNLALKNDDSLYPLCDAKDGRLNIIFYHQKQSILKKKISQDTFLSAKKIRLENASPQKQTGLFVDGEMVSKTPATIEVSGAKIKLIVGKLRKL